MKHIENRAELERTENHVALARLDELDNAAYEFLKVVTGNKDLDRNMECIGELIDMAANLMYQKNFSVPYPAVMAKPDGTKERTYLYTPDYTVLLWTMRDGAYWNEEKLGIPNEEDSMPDDLKKFTAEIQSEDKCFIDIWAHDEEEALDIADNLTETELKAYTGPFHISRRTRLSCRK